MVLVRPKPGKNEYPFLKPKLEKQVGKRVVHNGVSFKGVAFTEEWVVEQLGKWVNTTKEIGHVSGVKVGDEFHWRCELSIAGLHHDFQKGIVYMNRMNGQSLATSVVDSGRYDNVEGNALNTFIYCGEGENPYFGRKVPKDQKLVGGNLALRNNFVSKMPIRVIRKVNSFDDSISKQHSDFMAAGSESEGNDCGYKFVYYGLYQVTKYWHERNGASRKKVYRFLLKKIDEKQLEHDLGE
ncbi:SRA-YDG domain-containing protein [Corchorus capsularis]|uniref:SRA-YDG domain-containing protein n=1 Tax=Corchorus capsularis TaxID=210143 RepID=A0A1R3GSM9_COCAP|nr:SRA-YDG domain-containing protein [Corchorus capsularis]